MVTDPQLRLAELDDIPALEALIAESVMVLQAPDYTEAQRRGALGTVFGVDSQLIKDRTYFALVAAGEIIGCGGWSRRRNLFGSDAIAGKDDDALVPGVDAARIRAFFIKPGWERSGLGGRILQACETAATEAGFDRFELVATLTGHALFSVRGYQPARAYDLTLPDGTKLPVVHMVKVM